MLRIFLLFIFTTLSLFGTDYDFIVVGTSPRMMLEGLYQHHLGYRVLIVEKDNTFGGAWKSIDICNLEKIDMGCHLFGNQQKVLDFFDHYLGCNLYKADPNTTKNSKNFFPLTGCYGLTSQIVDLLEQEQIPVLLEHEILDVRVDPTEEYLYVLINNQQVTTKQLIVSKGSYLSVEGRTLPSQKPYYHIYLLIENDMLDQFTYMNGGKIETLSIARISNLTTFTHLKNSTSKIFAFEIRSEPSLEKAHLCFEFLKKRNLATMDAMLIDWDHYTYQQAFFSKQYLSHLSDKAKNLFRFINTNVIWNISSQLDNWKQVFPEVEKI